jgi:hypothetical protein
MIRRGEHAAHTEQIRNACKILVWKPEGKKPLGRPKHRCEDNIRAYLWEIGREYVGCIQLAQDRDRGGGVGSCEHGNESSGSIKGG